VLVMPSNNTGFACGYLAGRYGNVGHLFGPGGLRRVWPASIPCAVDNGRFASTMLGREWDEAAFLGLLDDLSDRRVDVRWVVVPDVVGDADGTLREWSVWASRLRRAYRVPLAIAVQDGMQPEDVPEGADVVFVGGTTKWKRKTLWQWCEAFDRVHVGRINTEKWLWECWRAGAESCDGTGWFRGDPKQLAGLERFLAAMASGQGEPQGHLYDCRRSEAQEVRA
jgi:hypothetical protein